MLELPPPTQVPTLADILNKANQVESGFLQNRMTKAQLPYVGPSAQAKMQLLQSQDALTQARAQNPMMGNGLTGAAGEVQSLQAIKNMYGANSPQYQQAQKLFNAKINSLNNRMNPTVVKLQNAYQQALASGNTQKAQQLKASIQKQTGTNQNINRSIYGEAIIKSLQSIPVDTLMHYSGPEGRALLVKDKIANVFGLAPNSYTKYEAYLKYLPQLTGQFTKFYGTSVTPQEQERIAQVLNPTSWDSNPQVTKQTLTNLLNTFNSESQVFNKGVNQGVSPYQKAQIPGLNPSSMVMIKGPNGQVYQVPASDAAEAIKAGGQRVG